MLTMSDQSPCTQQSVKLKVEHATLWMRTQPSTTFSGVQWRLPLPIEGVSILGCIRFDTNIHVLC